MRRVLAVLIPLVLAFSLVATLAPSRSEAISRAKVAKLLKEELRERGLDVKNVSRCRPKGGGEYSCRWYAKGRSEGGVPYDCRGRAIYYVRQREWQISKCANIKEPQIPLTPQPGAHPIFGYNEDWGGLGTKYFNLLGSSGAQIARQNLSWAVVEHRRGTRDWSHFDALYQRFLDRGIRPLWIVFDSPCWAQSDTRSCKRGRSGLAPSPSHYDAFASFAAEAAARYPLAVGIEVWNEPNYRLFWGGKPNPRAYSAMFKKVEAGIGAANPDMPVITAGLSPHHNNVRVAMGYPAFLSRLYSTGAAKRADMIGFHPYPSAGFNAGYIDRLRVHLARIDKVMRRNGDAERPIAVTEVGVSTSGADSYTGIQQGKALAKIYETLRRIEPRADGSTRIPIVVVHRFRDNPRPGHLGPNEKGFGVVTAKGNRKPAYCALARVTSSPC